MSLVLAYVPAYPPPPPDLRIPILVAIGVVALLLAIGWIRTKPPTL